MRFTFFFVFLFAFASNASAQKVSNTISMKDLEWDSSAHAKQVELNIPSEGSRLQGFMYRANGKDKHPLLLLLHGYPGNERNLDLAQVVRAHGWNVLYIDYRGSWGSEGKFSFENCVQDVVNTVAFCKKNAEMLGVDTGNIVLFGHSMGGWVCLKALQSLPGIKKGFALSTWNIYSDLTGAKTEKAMVENAKRNAGEYFVLNTPLAEIVHRVAVNPDYFNLLKNEGAYKTKQVIMLDEHHFNAPLADGIKKQQPAFFNYEVWNTDHPFTNKRISLINFLIEFLDK